MQDAKESKDAANAQIQMKAIRKVQKKQAEAAKQLGKTQNAELMALTRKLGEQVGWRSTRPGSAENSKTGPNLTCWRFPTAR